MSDLLSLSLTHRSPMFSWCAAARAVDVLLWRLLIQVARTGSLQHADSLTSVLGSMLYRRCLDLALSPASSFARAHSREDARGLPALLISHASSLPSSLAHSRSLAARHLLLPTPLTDIRSHALTHCILCLLYARHRSSSPF
eukprot:3830276-Pleurochrysis_carterae.AAC.1